MGKNKKNTKEKVIKNYLELLYMTPQAITAKDIVHVLNQTITEAEAEAKKTQIEFWESMDVLELQLPNGNSVDFEPVDINLANPSDLSFIKNRKVQTIFAITIEKESLELARGFFTQLTKELGGFICTDSEDFKPFYTEYND